LKLAKSGGQANEESKEDTAVVEEVEEDYGESFDKYEIAKPVDITKTFN
jgi:hypothetical protein